MVPIMQNIIRFGIVTIALCAALVICPVLLLAQSGSTGGSIGNDEKSLSGSRSQPSSDREVAKPHIHKSEDSPRSPRVSGRGGGNNFDGAWAYSGVGTNCQGSGSGSFVVSGGMVSGKTGGTGRISPNGAYFSSAVGEDGVALTATGRMSGNNGSGTYRRADGCMGNWTAKRM